MPWWKTLLFSFIPLLVLFAAAEIYFRLFPVYKNIVGRTRAGYVVPDKDLVWRLAPVKTGYRAVNDVGFRDVPMNWDAEYKVLLLGDSISWGDCVPHTNKIYPQVCERLLSKRLGKTVEIVNTGTPGYSTYQELKLLQLKWDEFQPDVVVLQFCLNDVVDRYRTVLAYGGDSVFLGVDTRSTCNGLASLAQYSSVVETIVRYLQRRGRDFEEYQVKNLLEPSPTREIRDAWAVSLDEIDEIRETAAKRGVPLLLLIAPFQFQLENTEALRTPQDKLIAFAKRKGITVVDLLPLFSKHKDEKLFADADHFSERGHELAAEALTDALARLLGSGH